MGYYSRQKSRINKVLMNWKDKIKNIVDGERRKANRRLDIVWTIGDGNEYETKAHAKIAKEIHETGKISIETLIEDIDKAMAYDEMLGKQITNLSSDEKYLYCKVNIIPKYSKEVKRDGISIDQMNEIDRLIKEVEDDC